MLYNIIACSFTEDSSPKHVVQCGSSGSLLKGSLKPMSGQRKAIKRSEEVDFSR